MKLIIREALGVLQRAKDFQNKTFLVCKHCNKVYSDLILYQFYSVLRPLTDVELDPVGSDEIRI